MTGLARTGLGALLSHWRRHPLQLAALLAGLALATALWTGVQAINAEARASYDRAAAALEGGGARIVARDGSPLGTADFVALRRAGWLVTPVLEGQINAGGQPWRLIGIDPLTAGGAGSGSAAPEVLSQLLGTGLLAAPADARALAGTRLAPVAAEGLTLGVLTGNLLTVQQLLDRPGEISFLRLLPEQPLMRPPLDEAAPGLSLIEPDDGSSIAQLTGSFHLNLTAFGLLAFAVGLFIVHGAIGLAFEQRRVMFRTLRALGLPLKMLIVLLAAELGLIALAAGAIGIGLGYGIAAALLPDVAATLRGLYGADLPGTLSIRAEWWLGGLAMAMAGTALAAASNLWRVARQPLLAPAQPRAWALAGQAGLRRQALAAGALLLAACGLALWGQGLIAGFALLGALLLGAALALPPLLSVLLQSAAARARRPLAQWFWADTRQQLPGLSLALMALLLALAANVGVGTMVASFRLTFTGWLDQRLASELYVTAADTAEARRLEAWLEGRADAVLPIVSAEGRMDGAPLEIYGIADHPTYSENWPLLEAAPDVWRQVRDGALLVNEQLARRDGLRPGDVIEPVPGWRAPVAGVYSDYGNPLGQVMTGLGPFFERFPQAERLRFGIRTDDPVALSAALTGEFGLAPSRLRPQSEIKALSLRVFEQTFAVTAALNVLTLGVAGFAMLTSLLTLAAMRLPQLAPVWAVGLTRARLAGIELIRALMLAALVALLAVPVGLLLAWALLAVVNVEAFGWRLPMHLFPGDWLRLGALALLAAGAAALWPALRLRRLPPARLLQVFANER